MGTLEIVTRWGKKLLAPWLIIVVSLVAGVACLTIGHFHLFKIGEGWGSLLADVGTAVLAGGVGSAVVKSFEMTGLFADELDRVLARRRSEIPTMVRNELFDVFAQRDEMDRDAALDTWRRTTKILLKDFNFPECDDAVETLGRYVSAQNDSYYSGCTFEYTIKAFDPDTGIYTIQETQRFHVNAKSAATAIPINYRWTERYHATHQELTVEQLLVDSVDMKPQLSEGPVNGRRVISYDLTLNGRMRYDVFRVAERKQSLYVENYIRFVFSRHATDVRVHVHGDGAKGLNIDLLAVGTDEFDHRELIDGGKIYEYKRLICPKQGFMLVMSPAREPRLSGPFTVPQQT